MSASILQYEEAAHGMMHRGAHFAQGSPVVVLDDGYWLLCHASSVAHPMDPPPPIHAVQFVWAQTSRVIRLQSSFQC